MSSAAATADGADTSPKTPPPRSPSRASAPSPPPYTEETPLLASQAEEGRNEHEEAALLEPPQSETRRTKSWWFWRILWTLLAALVLAVFIKGWVDAKDVEVCGYPMCHTPSVVHGADVGMFLPQFDLKGALKRALGGGLSGAAAMVLQVLLLMVRFTSAGKP